MMKEIQTLAGDYVVSQKLKEELSQFNKISISSYPLVDIKDGRLSWIISNFEDEKTGDWYHIIWDMDSLRVEFLYNETYKVKGRKRLGWVVTEEDMIESIESFYWYTWNTETILRNEKLIEIVLKWTEQTLMEL